jgi:hypothetical protein
MSVFGTSGLTKIPGAVYKVDQSGFATYDKSYSGILGGVIPFLQGDIADEWPNVVLLSIVVLETGDQCGHVKIDLHYEGKDLSFAGPSTSQNISIDFTTSQEPIESNPDFVTSIGGTPTAPKHGAFFDATTGEFLGFPVVDPDEPLQLPSRFAGLRSYLMPQETYTANSVEYDYPSDTEIESIGRVIDPGLPLPTLPGDRSWLNTGIRVQNIANVYYRTQRTGMLSGPRNWIPEVYGSI